MKKLLFLFILIAVTRHASAQVSLNEINADAAGQFLELYNSSNNTIDLSCYSIVIYKPAKTGSPGTGFYVLNIKNGYTIGGTTATRYFLMDQNGAGINAWTQKADIHYYAFTNPGYAAPVAITDPTIDLIADKNSDNIMVLLIKNEVLVDALVNKSSQVSQAQAFVNSLTSFNYTSPVSANECPVASIYINFQNYAGFLTNRNIAPTLGTNNEYMRSGDGLCSPWDKQQVADQTPGGSNPVIANLTGFTPPSWQITSATFIDKDGVPRTQSLLNASNFALDTKYENTYLGSDSLQFNLDANTRYATVKIDIGSINLQGEASMLVPLYIYEDQDGIGTSGIFDPADVLVYDQVLTFNSTSSTYGPITLRIPTRNPSPRVHFIQLVTPPSFCFYSEEMSVASPSALPATLKNIKVKTQNSINKITWTTSTESNNKGFEVQRALGNTNDFKTIGFVGTRAKDGNSQIDISYSFDDANIVSGQIHNYRLKQIDFDGKFSMSPVRSIKPGSIESNLNVYPNPSQGSVTVNTGSASGKLNIYVLDNTGRTVNQYLNVSATNTRISNLKKGLYTLKIVNTETGEQSAQRVVVQ